MVKMKPGLTERSERKSMAEFIPPLWQVLKFRSIDQRGGVNSHLQRRETKEIVLRKSLIFVRQMLIKCKNV